MTGPEHPAHRLIVDLEENTVNAPLRSTDPDCSDSTTAETAELREMLRLYEARWLRYRWAHLAAVNALTAAETECRFHGNDFSRLGMAYGVPRCDSCKQPWRVVRALEALFAADQPAADQPAGA